MLQQPCPETEILRESLSALWRLQVVLLGTLGFLVAVPLIVLVIDLMRGKELAYEGHWGGFGNAGRGWRLSRPLTMLITTCVFGLLFALVGVYDLRSVAEIYSSRRSDPENSKEAKPRKPGGQGTSPQAQLSPEPRPTAADPQD